MSFASRRLAGVIAALCCVGLLTPAASTAFTGTPAAVKLVSAMRAAYMHIDAVRFTLIVNSAIDELSADLHRVVASVSISS